MDYTSPGEALSKGLMQGVSLVQSVQQSMQQREQIQWERQLKTAELGMQLTENKNLPLDQRANAFNTGVRPVLKRMGIDMPQMNTATVATDIFQAAVKNANGVIDQMQDQKNPLDPHLGFTAITKHFTNALGTMQAENEAQKTQRELIVGNANKMVEESDKTKGHTQDKTPTPAEAIKRQSELDYQMANLNKIGTLDEKIAVAALKKSGYDIDQSKIDPAQINQFRNGIRREKSLLNEYIPDKYRAKEAISMDELKALKANGHSLEDLHKDFYVNDAPQGADPLKLAVNRKAMAGPTFPGGAPVAPPMAAQGPAPRPVTPPPLAMPAPMAAPAPVDLPTSGPLSLSGGSTQPSMSAPMRVQNQSLQ